jgi:hypothetical protein
MHDGLKLPRVPNSVEPDLAAPLGSASLASLTGCLSVLARTFHTRQGGAPAFCAGHELFGLGRKRDIFRQMEQPRSDQSERSANRDGSRSGGMAKLRPTLPVDAIAACPMPLRERTSPH